jgi:hypothetical protein
VDATDAAVADPSPQFTVALKADTSKLVFESVNVPSARFVPAVPSVSERLADVGVIVSATAGTPPARPRRQITAAGSGQCRSRKWFILRILARSTLAGKRLAGPPVPVVLSQQGGESHRTAGLFDRSLKPFGPPPHPFNVES